MFTIIGADGKEYGPVTSDQLKDWIAAGRANGQTKVKREGSTEWKLLAEYPEFAVDSSSPPPVTAAVAAPAAPAAPTAPAAPAGPVDPKIYADDLISRALPLDIFEVIGKSWELLKANFWSLVGATVVVCLVQGALGAIPYLGVLSGLLLSGVFLGGLYLYYLRFLRGEAPQFGDVFAGFTMAFVPLLLGGVVSSLLTTVGVFLLILPGIYLAVAWAFTAMLIIDKKFDFWTAMEISRRVITAQWWRVFGLMIVAGILGVLGVVALIVGVFFTLPIAIGSLVIAYETLCNPPPRAG